MGKGKKGKALFAIAGFFLGAGGWNPFGMAGGAGGLMGGLYGASLASTLWSSMNKSKIDSSDSINRFDKQVTGMSSTSVLPVIYGMRQWAGNQTYHKTYSSRKVLNKHIVFCEGGIKGVSNVTANDLIIGSTPGTPGTVFTVQNISYSDATLVCYKTGKPTKNDKLLRLYANGVTTEITLAGMADSTRDDMWDYNVSVESLIKYINSLGNGWQAVPNAVTKKSPEEIYAVPQTSCYNTPVEFKVDSAEGNTYYTLNDCNHPSTYLETGGYTGTAWIDCWLALSDELGGGNPNILATIEGKKVYDTRTGLTEYSTNPAMCTRDFLLSETYGLGKWITEDDIDEDYFRESADYCDEVIQYTDASGVVHSTKRYELNIVLDQKKNAIELLGDIMANFCGFLTITNDKLALRIEKATPVSYAFTEDNIVEDSFSIEQIPLEDTPNRYEISFVDPVNNWNSIKCIVEDTADQKERGKILSKTVELSGTTSAQQALRLGRFYRDFNKVCTKVVNISSAMGSCHLEPGDVVTVTYKVFTNMPFRITEIKEEAKGIFSFKLREYNESIYNDSLGAEIQWNNYTDMNTGYAKPPVITNVIAWTNTDDEILVEHDETTIVNFGEYRYYVEELET